MEKMGLSVGSAELSRNPLGVDLLLSAPVGAGPLL
jgi:hypothetical protein